MKVEIELSKAEAQRILGTALKERLAGTVGNGLEVCDIEWSRYSETVTVKLEPPEPPAEESAS